ncbi:MAG: Gldg family protein [Treponema sp.]|nr:Gldg family protein [Treponema sp.]
MRKRQTFFQFVRVKLWHAFSQPLVYAVGIAVAVSTALSFFVVHRFFSGSTTNLEPFFSVIPLLATVAVPVLCMKTENDRYDELLPLSDGERIVGRWTVALVKYGAVIVPLCAIPGCVQWFGDIDSGQACIGFLMLLLYGAAACALSILCTEFISHPAAAFVAAIAVLAFFSFSHTLSPVFRAVSFAAHFDAAGKGIVDSRDIAFYVVATVSCLGLAVLAVTVHRGKVFSPVERRTCLLACVVVVLGAYDAERFYIRADVTKDKKFSVSPYSAALLAEVTEPFRVTYWRTPHLAAQYPGIRDIEEYLRIWCGTNRHIICDIRSPATADERRALAGYGIYGQSIRTGGVNRTEYETVYSAIVLEYEGDVRTIPFILMAQTLEYDLAVQAETLIVGRERNVLLVSGNGRTIAADYSYVVPWLTAQGMSCTTGAVTDADFAERLDTFSGVVVVFGSSACTDEAALALESFIMRGGSVFLMLSPYTVDSAGDWSVSKQPSPLFSLLAAWGISFPALIATDAVNATITLTSTADAAGMPLPQVEREVRSYPFWVRVLGQTAAKHGLTLFWPTPLTVTDAAVSPLLVSSPACTPVVESSEGHLFDTNPFTACSENTPYAATGTYILAAEKTGSFSGWYTAQEQSDAHLIVVGDQYLVDSLLLEYNGGEYGDYRNLDFLTNCVLRLNGEDALARIHNKAPAATVLYKVPDAELFLRLRTRCYIVTCGIVPLWFIVCAVGIAYERRRRQRNWHEALQ